MISAILPALLLAIEGPPAAARPGYLRSPSLRGDTVVFVSEGDLWVVGASGGRATRLTTHLGAEEMPALSPDGTTVAFRAAYEGPDDVYVMALAGGPPRRLTFDAERVAVVGWSPGGEVLYSSQVGRGPAGRVALAAISPPSGRRTVFPLAEARDGCLDPSGRTLYFSRFGPAHTGDNARGYRGGAMAQLWRWDVGSAGEAVRLLPDLGAAARRPLCGADRVYFLSDRGGPENLWSVDLQGGDLRQHTREREWDVRSPSLDRGRIVYQRGADLRLLDLARGEDRPIPVELASDFDQVRTRWVKRPLDYLTSAVLAPRGDRVALTARGRVALAAPAPLRRVDVWLPPGGRARGAVLAPDGKWVYAICDAGGEEEVWRLAADGSAEGKSLTRGDGALLGALRPSPDGRRLAYDDWRGRLWLVDLERGSRQKIDDTEGLDRRYEDLRWSPDGRTLAVVRASGAPERTRIGLYSVDQRALRFVTSDRYESGAPAFSPDGRWLYFWSNRTFQGSQSGPWGDRVTGSAFDRRGRVYALALQPDAPFPFRPRTELDAGKPVADAEVAEKAGPALPAVAWEGLASRLFEVPLEPGNYADVRVDDKRLYLLERTGGAGESDRSRLRTLALERDEPRPELLVADVRGFDLSADGKRLLYQTWVKEGPGELFLVEAGPKLPEELRKAPPDTARALVQVSGWSLPVDPRSEWRQMFAEAWRRHRELLFDPNLRGLDWPALRRKYEPLVERIAERGELDDLLSMMIGELGVLHSQVRPGELRRAQDGEGMASLGAVLERAEGGWRIAAIHRAESELPSERGPFEAPGVDARVGDVVVSVNGQETAAARDLADLLRGRAGQQVLLRLRRGAAAPHAAVVVPVDPARAAALRYGDWELSRRERVEELGGGRVGYLHLRDTMDASFATFVREFYAVSHREGLVLDVRRNSGGNLDSFILEKLLRRVWAFWAPPRLQPFTNAQQTFRGHLAVLVDERTYSDGETLAAGVRALGLGTLVGTRTAGAGVWLSDELPLVDKGMARVAEAPWFGLDGKWMVEGVGVEPDVAVDSPPHATFRGDDPQLDAAVRLVLEKLAREPVRPLVPEPIPPRR